MMLCNSEGDNLLDSLGMLLLPKRRRRAAAWTVSFLLPQPTTSDGDDSSLQINETTNLPGNIPSYCWLANAAVTTYYSIT